MASPTALHVVPGDFSDPQRIANAINQYDETIQTLKSSVSDGNGIGAGVITDAQLANVAAWTLKGNNSGSAAAPQDFTIDALTAKTSPTGSDEVPIWDAAASQMKKATMASALAAIMPAPTRAGDVIYWNGSAWVALPGNNSGTKTLQETSSGVPSWASYLADPGAWNSYTPSLSATSGSFTSASATGRWIQLGKTVHFRATITITTNGTAAGGINLGLPTQANSTGAAFCSGGETSATGKAIQGRLGSGGATTINVVNYDGTYPGATGGVITVSGTYESA